MKWLTDIDNRQHKWSINYTIKSNQPTASFFRLLASLDPIGCSVMSSNCTVHNLACTWLCTYYKLESL